MRGKALHAANNQITSAHKLNNKNVEQTGRNLKKTALSYLFILYLTRMSHSKMQPVTPNIIHTIPSFTRRVNDVCMVPQRFLSIDQFLSLSRHQHRQKENNLL